MSILKGFAEITRLIDNNPSKVAKVGELSADSKTFVKDYLTYTNVDHPGLLFLAMQSLNDSLVPATPSVTQTKAMLDVIAFTYARATANELGPDKDSFSHRFAITFLNEFKLLASGPHILSESKWYPTSVTFCPIGREGEDVWTVWFADQSFNHEFDVSVLHIIPPVDNLDLFFNTPFNVQTLLDTRTPVMTMDRIDTIRGTAPYTVLRMDPFDWIDPNSGINKIQTHWTVIIYGRAGDNLDSVKDAIVKHILANTNRTVEEWANIFPDIFRSTEFIITPNYHLQGVPDQNFERGMYSAVSNYKDSLKLVERLSKGVGYTPGHIDQTLTNIPTLYRSVAVNLIPGPENRVGYKNFRDLYGDYVNVPTSHIDYMKMRVKTRFFVQLLTDMLEHAEQMTPSTLVPTGYDRIERDGVWYLGKSTLDALYLVVTKFSILKVIPSLNIPTDITT